MQHLDLSGVSVCVAVAMLPFFSIVPLVVGIIFHGLNMAFIAICFLLTVDSVCVMLVTVTFMVCHVAVEVSLVISLSSLGLFVFVPGGVWSSIC